MIRSKFSVFIYAVIALAAIGLVSQLFNNTARFFTNIFFMIGVGVVIFAMLYYFLLRKHPSDTDMKKYRQAVKQSKVKYKKSSAPPKQRIQAVTTKSRIAKKRPSHLRVIEGNKSKKKKRVSH